MMSHVLNGGLLPDSPDDALLQRILPYTYLTVPCPFCKAAAGSDCCTPNYSAALSAHAARKKAVRGHSDMDRYRAFAALRAKQVADRAHMAELMAKPLTAEQQALRAQVKAAFDEADKQFHAKERAMYARCRDPWIHNEACHCRTGEPYVHPAPAARVVREVTDLSEVRARKAVTA